MLRRGERRKEVSKIGCLATGHNRLGLEVGEQLIAERARLAQIASAETFADAARGVVRQVQRVVQPPSAVVVPQMMVRVSPVDSERKGCVAHYSCIICINPKQSPASRATKPVAARNNLSVGSRFLFISSLSIGATVLTGY